jgi:hypothetical protein
VVSRVPESEGELLLRRIQTGATALDVENERNEGENPSDDL